MTLIVRTLYCPPRLTVEVVTVPLVTIRMTVDGQEESLSEYLCDWPDCPETAVRVVGVVRELRLCTVMCVKHATQLKKSHLGGRQGH